MPKRRLRYVRDGLRRQSVICEVVAVLVSDFADDVRWWGRRDALFREEDRKTAALPSALLRIENIHQRRTAFIADASPPKFSRRSLAHTARLI